MSYNNTQRKHEIRNFCLFETLKTTSVAMVAFLGYFQWISKRMTFWYFNWMQFFYSIKVCSFGKDLLIACTLQIRINSNWRMILLFNICYIGSINTFSSNEASEINEDYKTKYSANFLRTFLLYSLNILTVEIQSSISVKIWKLINVTRFETYRDWIDSLIDHDH